MNIKMLSNFFRTAPKVKSDKVLEIEREGRMNQLLLAIGQERKGLPQTGRIKVSRVGPSITMLMK